MRTLIAMGAASFVALGCGSTGPDDGAEIFGSMESALCAADIRTNWAGQTIDSGTIAVTNDDTNLTITITGTNGWHVAAWHIYAGTAPVPVNRAGAAAPGQFPNQDALDAPEASVTLDFPLDRLGAACGSDLEIAVHTEMVQLDSNGSVRDGQTGWAHWSLPFSKGWGGSFVYTLCCDEDEPPPPPAECTQYLYFWKLNGGAWPVQSLVLGSQSYTQLEMMALLDMDPMLDPSVRLAQHVIAARLNQASGLPIPAHIQTKLDEADAWLIAYADADGRLPYGTAPDSPEAALMDVIKLWLHSYNAGYEGVPYCGDSW